MIYNGYILSVTEYKDDDAIVKLITDSNKIISVLAKGVKKLKAKNKTILFVLNKIEITTIKKGEVLILTGTKTMQDNTSLSSNLLLSTPYIFISSLVSFIQERLNKNVFNIYENLFLDSKNLYSSILKLIIIFYDSEGCLPTSGQCVACENKNGISDFSIRDNGFICKTCAQRKLKQNTLINIYNYIDSKEFKNDFDENDSILLINEFAESLEYKTGHKPKSTNFFINNLPKI